LLLLIHHLAVDGVSWRILMEDLWTAYAQAARGEPIQLPRKTTSFRQWAEHLLVRAQSAGLREELPFWLSVGKADNSPLPRDFNGLPNLAESARTLSVSLAAGETHELLHEVPKAYQTQINDVLLTALLQAFAEWTGQRRLLLDLEGHGREALSDGIDLSRTVGWFTSIFPVCLQLDPPASVGHPLMGIKEQLRRIPNRGIGYGLLRYLSADAEIARLLQSLPQPEVSFNYMGQLSSARSVGDPITLAVETSGPARSPRQMRRYLLEINASVREGQLQMDWTLSENIHQRSTIEALSRNFARRLSELIAHCRSPKAGGFTPSDFAKARISQTELDKLVAAVSKSERRKQ
jgi:non-ribosomal peptide synthase protein (TIGR01720 family)